MRKYKIIFLINGLSTGGAEMMLYRLLCNIDRNNFEPEVISLLQFEGPIKSKIEALNIAVNIIDIKSKLDLFSIYHLYKLLREKKPEILHTQLFSADISGRVIGRLLKIPIIISSIRNTYYGGVFRDLLIKLTEKFTLRTTIICRAAAERFIDDNIIPSTKLQIIYNGIDPEDFYYGLNIQEKHDKRSELGITTRGHMLLIVGSLTEQKGYYDLLRTAKLLKKRGNTFSIIAAGCGPLGCKLKEQVIANNLEKEVLFIGRYENVPNLMAAADIFVLSSLWEGLPGVVLEAMASELPVVATAVGGTPELVVDGMTGYLVPSQAPEELADALQKVMEFGAEERVAMGQAGRKRVEEHFHVKKMVAAYENLYLECLREKKLLKVADDEN